MFLTAPGRTGLKVHRPACGRLREDAHLLTPEEWVDGATLATCCKPKLEFVEAYLDDFKSEPEPEPEPEVLTWVGPKHYRRAAVGDQTSELLGVEVVRKGLQISFTGSEENRVRARRLLELGWEMAIKKFKSDGGFAKISGKTHSEKHRNAETLLKDLLDDSIREMRNAS